MPLAGSLAATFFRYSISCCALHGASLSLCTRKEKVSKEKTRPTCGPKRCALGVRSLHLRFRGTSRRDILVPSRLSRHPCRSTPSTPIPLTLLTGPLVRARRQLLRSSVEQHGFGSRTVPVRRPSAGAVQRGIWHGCQMRSAGPWMALRDDPLNSAVARAVERSETRMPGGVSLLTFFAQAKKVGRPEGRNLSYLMHSIFTSGTKRSARRMLCP